jgi:hypothetical protein
LVSVQVGRPTVVASLNRGPRALASRTNGGSIMRKYLCGAGMLIAFAAPALATSSTTTTTTTGGSTTTTTEQYFVVRDPSTKRCTVSTSRPSGGTTVVVGDTVYKSRTEAETAVTKVCTN